MKAIESLTSECINLLKRHNLLKQLIKSEYKDKIIDEVILDKKLEEEHINKFLQQVGIISKKGVDNEKKYEEWLKSQNLTKTEVKKIALSEIKLKIYNQQNFGHKVEARFLERKNNLDIFVYSLIRVKDAYQAKEIYTRILCEEESFGNLAKQHSEGMEKKTGGIVGPISLESTHPALAEVLRQATPGKVQYPIRLVGDNGTLYLIVRLETFEPAKLDEFMSAKMALEMFDDWLDIKANKLLKSIMENQCGEDNE